MKLIKLTEVMASTGLARSTVYKYIKTGTFPKPVPQGERAVAWLENEIQEWIMERVAERDNDELHIPG